MGEKRGKDDRSPRLEDLAGRLLGTVLDVGWAVWTAAREVADFSLRAARAAADVLLDAGRPRPGDRSETLRPGADAIARGSGTTTSGPAAVADREAIGLRTPPPAPAPGIGQDPFVPPLPDDDLRDHLAAVERDPETLFAWWDVTSAALDRARAALDRDAGTSGEQPRVVLQVAVDDEPPREVDLPAFATSSYVERPGEDVAVAITLGLSRGGRFARLVGPFSIPARAPQGGRSRAAWRRVGGAAAGARAEFGSPSGAFPSPRESERLVSLSSGSPESGSPPCPDGRRRGRRPGNGGPASPPSSC